MKKIFVCAGCLISTTLMAAMPVYQPAGSSFTLGTSANERSLSTSLANPAAPFLMVNSEEKDSFRFGVIGPIGIGYEMGDIGDLKDRIDKVQNLIDKTYTTTAEADSALNSANNIINGIADTAYVKASASVQVPFMPIIYKTKKNGAFMLDASVSGLVKGTLLTDDITRSGTSLTSNTAVYAQSATDTKVGLGYSQSVWKVDKGELIGGVKVNVHQIKVGRALSVVSDSSQDAGDAFSDSFSNNKKSTSGVGVDLGAIWSAQNYQLGITLANINQPKYDYSDLGDCTALSGTSLTNCNAAVALSNKGKLSLTDSYQAKMQTTLDAAVTTKDRRWTLSGSYDANAVKDPVGDEYQWGTTSLSYYGDSHWLPGVRIGYKQNMAGSKLSYATAGLTLLKRLNLDIAYGLQTVKDQDGKSLPRSAYISLGYDSAF